MRYLVFFLLLSFPIYAQAPATPKPKPKIPWGVLIRASAHYAVTALDIQGTQHCLHEVPPGCVESNPLVPYTAKGAWTFGLTITSLTTLMDYECWKKGKKFCWIAPVEGIIEHSVGAGETWSK